MNWSNVILILKREIRDQLRDRRTLFMIFVLPVLLYPFMGMTFLQLSQFLHEQPTRVMIIGREQLPEKPALIERIEQEGVETHRFVKFKKGVKVELLELNFPVQVAETPDELQQQLEKAKEDLREGVYHAVIFFPETKTDRAKLKIPNPEIFHNTAKKKSTICYRRVHQVLEAWRNSLVKQNLVAAGLPESAAVPFEPVFRDVAAESHRFASAWSVAFPLMMLLWALTGAFYPAIDLCAGEKERGTLETLLSSPAERVEIVWGKLLTVMLFSLATVTLNLLALGGTCWILIAQLPKTPGMMLGPPPVLAFLWVFLAMIPLSAMFSALCLALASFARSNKEGQYYLMPLFLVTLPLVALPMWPSFELNLGNSLIPLTGVVLILKAAIEGDYLLALRFLLPVAAVTSICCLLAIRWAVDQFNKESVLFSEGERFDLVLWLRHLVRDRKATPTVAAAVICGAVILSLKFVMELSLAGSSGGMVSNTVFLQLAAILAPTILMTIFLTRSPRQTLLLRLPVRWTPLGAIALALLLHPVIAAFRDAVVWLYPISPEIQSMMEGLFKEMPGLGTQLLLIAVLAPLCEEIAFRGFILSGFRRLGRKWMAIGLTSILFGLVHGILQQSIVACVLGMLIGYLAVQTGSLLPALVFHMAHNGLVVIIAWLAKTQSAAIPFVATLLGDEETAGAIYSWPAVVACGLLAALLIRRFSRLKYQPSEEERLQESIRRESLANGQPA